MSNKTCSMDNKTETFSLSYCKDNNEKKSHKLLKNFAEDNADYAIHSGQIGFMDHLCWRCYSANLKISKTLEIAKRLTMKTQKTIFVKDNHENIIAVSGINYHKKNSVAEVKCFICIDNDNKIFCQILEKLFTDQRINSIVSLHHNRRRGLNGKEIAGCIFARNNFEIKYLDPEESIAALLFPRLFPCHVLSRQQYLEQSANS